MEEILYGQMRDRIDRHLEDIRRCGESDRRSGGFSRHFLTELGDIELSVPRTRRFSALGVVRAYARRVISVDRMILCCFVLGLSMRKVAQALLPVLGERVSSTTVSRVAKEENTVVRIECLEIGGPEFIVMAGPCSIESEGQLMESAYIAKKAGAQILRGGAFKPRTSPYSFHGLEWEGLKLLKKVREKTGIPVVTEVIDTTHVNRVEGHADILQVGARNVQNFALLREVGRSRKPVLLKRGMMTTIEELPMSVEYILSCRDDKVIPFERGIRTFETATRNTLDISAVPVLKELTHLPVIVDPSHAAGHWKYVLPLAKSAVAVGADGLLIEVHPEPEKALSDGIQSLKPKRFCQLMHEVKALQKTMRTEIRALQ